MVSDQQTAPSERLGCWGSLTQDLVSRLGAFLPIRERFGVLPLLNRHFYATSRSWEIGRLGISELFLPATRLSTEALKRRSERVLAWLAAHRAQLGGLRCDLQQQFSRTG
ncbi:hypothetical protein ABPG75_007756 [Micractinium tetrahymenae]